MTNLVYPSLLKDKIRMGAIYEYIDANYNRKPDVNVVAGKVYLTISCLSAGISNGTPT